MKARMGMGSAALTTINVSDAQTLLDFVNEKTDPDTAIAALTIAMQNCGGGTPVADIVTSATDYYTFMYKEDTPA